MYKSVLLGSLCRWNKRLYYVRTAIVICNTSAYDHDS